MNIQPKFFVRPMYSKTLLFNVTLRQNNLFFLGLNATHTDFTKLNIMPLHILKLKHTSNICYKPIAPGAKKQILLAYIT